MSDLSPEQLAFAKKYLNFESKRYLAKKRLKSQLKDFWRRRDKALEELKILPPDHPRRAEFETAIKDANEKAEKGKLKDAYDRLKSVKVDARTEADTVKNGLSLATITPDLAALDAKTATARAYHVEKTAAIKERADRLKLYATMTPVVAEGVDREDVFGRARDLTEARREFTQRLDALDADVKDIGKTFSDMLAAAPNIKTTLDRLMHNVELLRAEKKITSAIDAQLLAITQRDGECDLSGSPTALGTALSAVARECRQAVIQTLDAHKTFPEMDLSGGTDRDGTPIKADDIGATTPDWSAEKRSVDDIFAHLEERDRARIEAARKQMEEAANYDRLVLGRTVELSKIEPSRVEPFQTVNSIGPENYAYDPLDKATSVDELKQDAQAYFSHAMDHMTREYATNGGKVPDELLEVATRTREDWLKDVAMSLGTAWNPDTLTDDVKEKIETVADELRKKALEIYPDKANADMSSFTMGGEKFDDLKKLGEGGGGIVYLATSASGKQVVIKKPTTSEDEGKYEANVADMRNEVMTHRAVTGGETGACHENLLEHQGMVMGPEGIPYPVMDLADAGDAHEYSTALDAAAHANLLGEPARQAMMAAQLRDIIQGVKAMHDQGFAHLDLKNLNVFMTKDGTLKVADFGLAQEADTRDTKLEGAFETTEQYKAPEIDGSKDLTQKADNFSLGAMLRTMLDPVNDWGRHEESFGYQRAGPGAKTDDDGEVISNSASTRLISKLMSDDPDERPTLESALESSFLDGLGREFSPEALDRLRKATVAYATTVGKETAKIDTSLIQTSALLVMEQKLLTGRDKQELLAENERFVKQTADKILLVERKLANETDPEKRKALDDDKAKLERHKASAEQRVANNRKALETIPDGADRRRIEDKIAALKKQIADLRKQAAAIRDDPKHADVMKELAEANAMFR